MRILILTFLAFFTFCNAIITHKSVSATFNVIKRGHVLMLEIDFDDENFIKFTDYNSLKVTKQNFSKYLHKTTNWKIDGIEFTPQILSLKSNKQHTKVICFLSKAKKNIKTIQVRNEFLINVKNHSNIIKLDINNSFKDYRMHKNRIELFVAY